MNAIFFLIDKIVEIYLFFIFVWVIMGWLLTFGVLPTHNQIVSAIMDFLYRITEPALGRIRRFLPPMGGMDLSPLVLILLIYMLQIFLRRDLAPFLGVGY